MKKGFIYGLTAIFAANIIWGVMAPMLKSFLNMGVIDPMTLSALRMVGGAILFWIVDIITPYINHNYNYTRIDAKDIWKLIIASLLIIIGTQVVTTVAMKYTYPIDVSVLCSTTPFFTLLLSALFLRQKPKIFHIAGVIIGFIGLFLFVTYGQEDNNMNASNPLIGNVLCILSQVFGATYLIFFTNIIKKYNALTLMKWLFTISGVCILPFTASDIFTIHWAALGVEGWADMLYIIILGSCFSYLLLPIAQRTISPTSIAICNYIQPITATIVSVIIGVAAITGQNLLATLLIFAGVWLVNKN